MGINPVKKQLVINYEVCKTCGECPIECSYPYHNLNNGSLRLREIITWEAVCRRCSEPGCVAACPNGALKKREDDDKITRSPTLCVSCKSCTLGCPFGTILPELVPYLTTACDYCLNRLEAGETPLCVQTCPQNALAYRAVSEGEERLHPVDSNVAGLLIDWQQANNTEEKK